MRLQAFIAKARAHLGASRIYEIELLIADVLGFSRAQQRILDVEISKENLLFLEALLMRLAQGEPLAYVLERQDFYDLCLKINPSCLIPRPDSECLLQAALDYIPEDAFWAVADLGTGSGALALALAKHRPNCLVVALDKSRDSLLLARENALLNKVHNVCFVQSDWLGALQNESFDLVLSNPPYIAEDDPHLKDLIHEPRHALVAENNGFADLYYLLENAGRILKNNGFLLLEHGFTQGASLRDFAYKNHWQDIKTLRDYGGRERVLCVKKAFL